MHGRIFIDCERSALPRRCSLALPRTGGATRTSSPKQPSTRLADYVGGQSRTPTDARRLLPPRKQSPVVTHASTPFGQNRVTTEADTKGPLSGVSAAQRPFLCWWAIPGSKQAHGESAGSACHAE